MTALLTIVAPGLHTTVQDLGRWGHQSRGVSVSGAMDPYSHRLANALVGNERSAATLEITLSGPEIEFEDDRIVAIAGATFAAALDGHVMPHETPFRVRKHAHLRVEARVSGARAYIAVSGGIDVPRVLGSRSTHAASGMGGYRGRSLERGDRVPLGANPSSARSRPVPASRRPGLEVAGSDGVSTVRVLPGPHADRFAAGALEVLQAQPYVVSSQANRMGYRLEGPVLTHSRGADLISQATAPGALQVPGAGQPVLLMADRPTTGGYPCLATVISADIPIAAQVAPGERLRFEVCAPAEALSALIARERVLLAQEREP
jgi:antagonist of KipI